MKARQYINMIGMAAAVLLSSCVKDTLYDTPHPDYGKIAVTADWSVRGEGIDIPATWTVTMGDYMGTETSATHTPDHLFAPGSYTLAVWNPAEGITVNGTTATIAAATGTRAGTDAFVNNAPGWFFTYTEQVKNHLGALFTKASVPARVPVAAAMVAVVPFTVIPSAGFHTARV